LSEHSFDKSDTWSIIEEELGRKSIFRSKESLTPEYLPEKLPYRENELRQLISSFKHIVTSPGSISQRVLIVGSVGTGKTALSRVFGRDFTRYAQSKGVNVKYIHVNCHRNRTLTNIVVEIAKQLNIQIPTRGFSYKEMYDIIMSYLDENDIYAIIALDEFHYFANLAGSRDVYFIVRTYDDVSTSIKRLNFIFISLNTAMLSYLDQQTESYLLQHMIKLKPYSSEELFTILKYRSEQAFYEDVVSDEVLKFIADYEGYDRGGGGNARTALEILFKAGIIAESEGANRVTLEHVRKAIMTTSRELLNIVDALLYIPIHELIILWAIIRVLRRTGQTTARMGDVEREYALLCEILGEQPRRHTQVYEYVMNLKKTGIIEARVSGKGQRGRTTLVSVHYGPLDLFEKHVQELVEKRLRVYRNEQRQVNQREDY